MSVNFDINNFITDFDHSCHKVQKKTFDKGEVITSYIQKRNQFCILVSGNADLVRYDLNGNRSIIEHFSKNDIFGEVFYNVTINKPTNQINTSNNIISQKNINQIPSSITSNDKKTYKSTNKNKKRRRTKRK